MVKRTVSEIMLLLLLIGIFALAFNVQPVKASGTIYIRADGSIDPPDAPISTSDNVTYTFTDNIYDNIVVERDSIVIDGQGYNVRGVGTLYGVNLSYRSNVTIMNVEIEDFYVGIYLYESSNNDLVKNSITANEYGIYLYYSSTNRITENNVTANQLYGILLHYSSNNSVIGNNVTLNARGIATLYEGSLNNAIVENNIAENGDGVYFHSSKKNILVNNKFSNDGLHVFESYENTVENNTVNSKPLIYYEGVFSYTISQAGQVVLVNCNNMMVENLNLSNTTMAIQLWRTNNSIIRDNNILANGYGIFIGRSSNNRIFRNDIKVNSLGVYLYYSLDNKIFHNNFFNNKIKHAQSDYGSNIWDNSYPSGGNYWSGYTGYDVYSGPGRDQLGSDGVGDSPYTIDVLNKDRYPFMAPINFFDVGVWNGESQKVYVVSNSTISNFQLNATKKIISFNVAGEAGFGFCRVTMPIPINEELWGGNYTVLIDGKRVETRNWTDAENTYIYFAYEHSELEVTILQTYTTFLQISTTEGGQTNPTQGLYAYLVGEVVSISAIPYKNYILDHWLLDGTNIGSNNPIEILMHTNHTLHAVFTLLTYNLSISTTIGGTTNPAPGTYTYTNGTMVSVTAIPEANYIFDHWELDGTPVGSTNPIEVIMTANHTLEAFFTQITYQLTISTTTGGTTNPTPGAHIYVNGTVVSVTAIPDINYRFEYWILDGMNVGSDNPIAVVMDSNHSLQVVFTQITYQLTITSTEGGTTDPAPGTHTYVNGTVVLVTALPDVGYSFDYWLLDGEVRTENPISILMDMNHTLEAFFTDNLPPEIGEPVQEPSEDVEPFQNVTITVNVTDVGTGVCNVTLWYSMDNGTTWMPFNMTEISVNTYQAMIPGRENCTWVTYKIIAYDNSGNSAVNDNHGYYYKYHVIPEFPLALILPLLMLTTLVATVLLKRKRKTKPQLP